MIRARRRQVSLLALAISALPLSIHAQAVRIGTEFQVNTFTPSNQGRPSVATSASGDFVVVWQSSGQAPDLSGYGVFARRFSSAGAPQGSELAVNTYADGVQREASVGMDADGDFVVAWESYQDGGALGVFARRFSSAGAALASEFQVNAYTASLQGHPSVAAIPDGDFVVAWESYGQDGSFKGVFARRFSSTGDAVAGEFQVNTYTTAYQILPSVAANIAGDFVIAWVSNGQDGDGFGVFARAFSSAGTPLGAELQVNSYTSDAQRDPTVALAAGGDFAIAWASNGQDGSSFGIFARAFSSAGAPLASEFQVNAHTLTDQGSPSLTAASGGDFVVAWSSTQDGSGFGVFARTFSSAGALVGGEFQLNTYTTGNQHLPSLAADADGNFVVAWHDTARDGSGYGIFGQRFTGPAELDIDGNGATLPLTDGLLVLRRFFGFTGTTLTTGAVDLGGCTRCDAAAIEAYIAGLGLVLDIDGNAAIGALTDGLLALRYLFGFTGATLTTGAVDLGGCTRCNAAAIEPYLAGLTP